jgi:hypothetical protein
MAHSEKGNRSWVIGYRGETSHNPLPITHNPQNEFSFYLFVLFAIFVDLKINLFSVYSAISVV